MEGTELQLQVLEGVLYTELSLSPGLLALSLIPAGSSSFSVGITCLSGKPGRNQGTQLGDSRPGSHELLPLTLLCLLRWDLGCLLSISWYQGYHMGFWEGCWRACALRNQQHLSAWYLKCRFTFRSSGLAQALANNEWLCPRRYLQDWCPHKEGLIPCHQGHTLEACDLPFDTCVSGAGRESPI